MSKIRRNKSNRFATAVLLLVVAAAGTVALALYVKLTPADRVIPSGPDINVKGMPAPDDSGRLLTQVKVPVIHYETDKLGFEAQGYAVEAGANPMVAAVNEFLKQSKLLDPKVHLMSVDLEDRIANLHFSEGFDSGAGSMDEAALIYGIRAVMGQFSEIENIRIFVEGEQIQELGHIEFGDLVPTIPVSQWNDPASAPTGTKDETPPPSMPR